MSAHAASFLSCLAPITAAVKAAASLRQHSALQMSAAGIGWGALGWDALKLCCDADQSASSICISLTCRCADSGQHTYDNMNAPVPSSQQQYALNQSSKRSLQHDALMLRRLTRTVTTTATIQLN